MHSHGSLIILCGGENLICLCRNRCIALDQLRHHAAHGFNTQAQRRHIQQQYILHVTAQHTTLNRSTNGNGFIGIHVLARLLAEKLLHSILNLGHTDLTTHHDDIINITHRQARIFQRQLTGLNGAGDQIVHQRLQLGAGNLDIQVLGTGRIGGDIGQIHIRLLCRRKLDFCLLCRLF